MENLSAKELRIGNWIRHKYSEPDFIVSEINAFSENNTVNGIALCDCEPIPITEQWLVDLGLDKTHYEKHKVRAGWVGDDFIKAQMTVIFNEKFICKIKYVHELQNLYFALTGRELEFKTKTL